MNIHLCLYCNAPINMFDHGNRQYCPDKDCYRLAKQLSSLKKYYDNKGALQAFSVSDSILETFHDIYGENVFILGIQLDRAGMNWQISKSEATMDGLPVKIIGNYGYCLFKDETVKIWKTLFLQMVNQ